MASSPLSTATVVNSNHSMCSTSASFFLRVVVVVVSPRVVVSGTAQGFEAGSDIYTSDRGIVARNSVEYGVALESALAFAPSFSRSRRVALRVGHTKQCAAGRNDGAVMVASVVMRMSLPFSAKIPIRGPCHDARASACGCTVRNSRLDLPVGCQDRTY